MPSRLRTIPAASTICHADARGSTVASSIQQAGAAAGVRQRHHRRAHVPVSPVRTCLAPQLPGYSRFWTSSTTSPKSRNPCLVSEDVPSNQASTPMVSMMEYDKLICTCHWKKMKANMHVENQI